MRQKTVRDLHLRTAAILDEVAAGQTVVITRRGTPVAEIRPFRRKALGTGLPDREAWLARFPQVKGDSGRFLEEDRS
jgi:prevent-host-death family protein